ncbi:chalcone isomerase family protein [Pseudohaliea rubra]|uniref:Chalcone isomerase domain-containing protein n=1 Tax=Pseudohaliea rubra DSM 19751 TaxID=1265313 RepID=A0A095X0E2_9GAMM|nr:chalcone isomerase family protein [Pseudohaliea rubra]KGE04364.1 hypothetical protein HRUBRA_01050 [Pseudohaliea rubra DSM 19751]
MSHTFSAHDPSGSQRYVSLVLFVAALILSPVLLAGAKPAFPPVVSIEEAGERHRLLLTGRTERVFFIFRVYEIAHYAELAGGSPLDPGEVVTDGRGKALMIHFQRDLGVEQIREEFDRSLRRNAQPEWLQEARDTIASFLAAIDRGARAGDQLQFFWLDGGRLFVNFNGERVFAASDLAFAKLIWSIWFGADPVCDREDLLALVAPGAAL